MTRSPLPSAAASSDSERQRFETVFERLAPVDRNRAIDLWLGLTAAAILSSFAISLTLPDNQVAFRSLGILLSLGFIMLPLGINLGYGIMLEWARQVDHFARHRNYDISAWFRDELAFIRGDEAMGLSGAALGLLTLFAYLEGGYLHDYAVLPRLYLALLLMASAAFAGMGLYVVYRISRVFWQLGKLEHLSLQVHEHRFGVLSIGVALFRCWMIIGFIWAVYLSTAFLGYPGPPAESVVNLPPMWLLAYPTLPFIVGSFIVCQIPLHRKMVAYKRAELQRLDSLLDQARAQDLAELDGELRGKVEFLGKQKLQARALPEWPFNRASLLGTGASSMTALLPMLLNGEVPKGISYLFGKLFPW